MSVRRELACLVLLAGTGCGGDDRASDGGENGMLRTFEVVGG